MFVKTVTIEKEKMKLQLLTKNQKLKSVITTITIEHYWSALVFRVKHI